MLSCFPYMLSYLVIPFLLPWPYIVVWCKNVLGSKPGNYHFTYWLKLLVKIWKPLLEDLTIRSVHLTQQMFFLHVLSNLEFHQLFHRLFYGSVSMIGAVLTWPHDWLENLCFWVLALPIIKWLTCELPSTAFPTGENYCYV